MHLQCCELILFSRHFNQTDRVSMGFPLDPVFADMLMGHHEKIRIVLKNLINLKLFYKDNRLMIRYLYSKKTDFFFFFFFFEYLNCQPLNIKFMMEKEAKNHLLLFIFFGRCHDKCKKPIFDIDL